MKYLNKLFIIVLFFIPLFSYAGMQRQWSCLNTGFLDNQGSYPANITDPWNFQYSDCYQQPTLEDWYQVYLVLSPDQTELAVTTLWNPFTFDLYNWENSSVQYDSTGIQWALINNSISDGEYTLQAKSIYDGNLAPILLKFYKYNNKYYLNYSDIPQSNTSLDPSLGSLNFGLAIVIVLLSLSSIFSIYNLFTKKRKPWQK